MRYPFLPSILLLVVSLCLVLVFLMMEFSPQDVSDFLIRVSAWLSKKSSP